MSRNPGNSGGGSRDCPVCGKTLYANQVPQHIVREHTFEEARGDP